MALKRVSEEPAFVLHRYDWSETSLVLEVFTRHHGRIALVAKGVKRPTSQFRPVLLPLQPIQVSWTGDAEVRSLKAAQWSGGHVMPTGEALISGAYLNELLMRLLARDDPHPRLFDHFATAVQLLSERPEAQNLVLRAFELLLLRDIGLLPDLSQEGQNLQALDPAAPYVLAARSSLGIKTYAQLVDYAKANPGKLNFGSAGNASSPHLGLELLKLRESLDILHIPFKSGGEAVNAAVGGQVDLVMDAVPVVMPHVQSGKLDALMLASSTPVQGAEQVPTTQQLGKPDLNIASWAAFYVPAGTPDAVVARLNEALKQALSSGELRSRVAAQGIQLYSGELAEHDAFLASERKRWVEIVKRANITLN